MHRRLFLTLPLVLVGCDEPAAPALIGPEEAAGRVHAFDARRPAPATTREALVFFDSQCKYCAMLWRESAPLTSQLRFRWIPVAMLSRASLEQGATLLGAPDAAAAMHEHERLLAGGRRGITADVAVAAAWRDAVKANTAVFHALRATSVPLMLWRDRAGVWRTAAGAYSTAELRRLLEL